MVWLLTWFMILDYFNDCTKHSIVFYSREVLARQRATTVERLELETTRECQIWRRAPEQSGWSQRDQCRVGNQGKCPRWWRPRQKWWPGRSQWQGSTKVLLIIIFLITEYTVPSNEIMFTQYVLNNKTSFPWRHNIFFLIQLVTLNFKA